MIIFIVMGLVMEYVASLLYAAAERVIVIVDFYAIGFDKFCFQSVVVVAITGDLFIRSSNSFPLLDHPIEHVIFPGDCPKLIYLHFDNYMVSLATEISS